ncbi:unnamed protein product [Cuscuta epithymum]|uniref:Ubiquitin-like protease family profile domain-containing protein n=1 Tax=Cuscuta epithymum TaxID=186058 RepID=A0AAV0DK73_9ASTE|nr:unnamed protein product [Cuscuta epithymum]
MQRQNMPFYGESICMRVNYSFVKNVPRKKRSKRGYINKKGWPRDGSVVKLKTHLLHVKTKKTRTCKKQICMDFAETSDDEVIPHNSMQCRGRSRRRYESNGLGKLDSGAFECYMRKIWMKFSEERKSLFTCLDSLWYHLYTDRTTKAKVLDWIKKKEIFTRKYVIVPIIQWGHWCLLIMCNMGKTFQSETPCLLLLDSLQDAHAKQLESGIRKFVFDLYSTGERTETKQMIKKIPFRVPKVPQQRNNDECGYYVLYFIDRFLGLAPEDFSLSEGYPYYMKEDWFTPEELDVFCKELVSSSMDSSECDDSSSDSDVIELGAHRTSVAAITIFEHETLIEFEELNSLLG